MPGPIVDETVSFIKNAPLADAIHQLSNSIISVQNKSSSEKAVASELNSFKSDFINVNIDH